MADQPKDYKEQKFQTIGKTDKAHLGMHVYDVITGSKGIVTGICSYITGCDQYCVSSKAKDEHTKPLGQWLDINRLAFTSGHGGKLVLDTDDNQGSMTPPEVY